MNMPTTVPSVTIFPAPHGANLVTAYRHSPYNPRTILKQACPEEYKDFGEMIQSSFDMDKATPIISTDNGFVHAVRSAYASHHHLRIRPEDVWGAILTQFSFFVNAHAEELRRMFVAHEGKKKLVLTYVGTRKTFDFGVFAADMGRLIQENVLDEELREWIIPAFSTTTRHDVIVASIVMMGTMKKYFDFGIRLVCGLPSVTLLGTKEDYELILRRLEKLPTFGKETAEFAELLRPVIRRFIESFDHPSSPETLDFWNRIYKAKDFGSGPAWMSGWITAFCFWDAEGKRLAPNLSNSPGTAKALGSIKAPMEGDEFLIGVEEEEWSFLEMDGVEYPRIEEDDVPSGFCTVPVQLTDERGISNTMMIAGSVGIALSSSGEASVSGEVGLDTMQPHSGWWMFETLSQDAA